MWPVGGVEPRRCLDRWVDHQLEHIQWPSISKSDAATRYLRDFVLANRDGLSIMAGASGDKADEPISIQELVEIFFAVRDGRFPAVAEVQAAVADAFGL
ncbi:hypothetical protein HZ993_09675 [Rhodoferax sp. AJA081-3]|uniref:hypothetical protein n=1 Tax=Rhodoferax sp. AJA081-3 TaxID=2752316 RepID=UPI001AE06D91|nr:hypothetical protein [Rhodoferax sp. AJA081-3]QTN30039.1 hypothetical protein HZ993_09675 [Rhodoferax sp. AJA081-3]